jgi:putative ABC transport system permease protein
MIFNYLKIAFRNLLKNKGFSAINIFGLAMGMASAILIILWINHEISYDQFHEKKDRIYEAWNQTNYEGNIAAWNTTPKVLAKTITQDLPEIEKAVRVNWTTNVLLTAGEKKIMVYGNTVDSCFLQVFSFPVIKGNAKTALYDNSSIVITSKLSRKLFGTDDAVGKIITIDTKDNFTVAAVLKDLPTNSRFNFEYLLPWSYLRQKGNDDEYWGNNSTKTYALLKPAASLQATQAKLKHMREKYDKDDPKMEMFLYPLSKWRLYSNFENGKEAGGLIAQIKIFALIAIFILLIACINFMNLSTARSEKRAKEVGIRKVVGALKGNLIGQFLGESILIALLAGILALLLVQLSLPAFNTLTGKKLTIGFANPYYWLFYVGFILFTGIIAGSYPAFYLSAFKPSSVLKGTFKKVQAAVTPRKILVVVQFSFAIILILSTIVVRRQLKYAQERANGYEKNNLVFHFTSGDLDKNYPLVKQELLAAGIATSVTKTSAPLTEGWSNSNGFDWPGKPPGDKTLFDRYCADEGLVKTAGLQLVSGRDFDLQKFSTDSAAILLNESAVKAMKLKDPIGAIIGDNGLKWHVVGVFKDFILRSPYYAIDPMIIEGAHGWFNVIHFKLNSLNSTASNLKKAETIFKKYNPNYPFEYKFIDLEYATKFENEQKIAKLSALFAGLTIFISCLGLFGLATYMTATRVKEIGVRKILGASVGSITSLLSKDFIKLVLIAFLIASPIAWWAMNSWLASYTYRTPLEWWLFAITGALAFLIAIITVSFQAIKAAIANPVKSLRSE